MKSILRLYQFMIEISDLPFSDQHSVGPVCCQGVWHHQHQQGSVPPCTQRILQEPVIDHVPISKLGKFKKFQAGTVSAQAAGGQLGPLTNAIGNLLTNIIKLVKQLLDQLLPTLNSLLQDVGSLKIVPNLLFSRN